MSSERWEKLSEQFDRLCDLAPEARARELARLARADFAFAAELGGMLEADSRTESALDRGAVAFDLPTSAPDAAAGADAAADAAATAGLMLGPWRLLERLGAGGMGEVWTAERADGAFTQRVAVKLLKRGLETDALLRRFANERQILARLEHPGIARLVDAGASPDGRPYFVMERVDGAPITAWVEERKASVEARLRLLIQVCAAVEFAHRNLVVHRDLKPSNILVDSRGDAKLLDFGVAKLLTSDEGDATRLTELGGRALTPAYAAPEQIRGEPVTTATDVYALGVLLYELLTGRLPHRRARAALPDLLADLDRESVTRPSQAVLAAGANPALRQRARALAGDLDNIALKAMAADPARRYPNAAELARDLERHVDGRPVAARPDAVGYRAAKFVRRHRWGVAAAALLVLSLVAGMIATTWQARRAADHAERAEQVKRFLVDVFRQVDPTVAHGREISAREVLESGRKRVEAELAEAPALAADLDEALAEIYSSLGLAEQAEELAKSAVALRETRLPADPAARLRARRILGEVHIVQSRYAESVAVLEPLHAEAVRRFGADSLEVAEIESPLASALNESDRARALVLKRHVYEVRFERLGPDDPRTIFAHLDYGDSLDNAGEIVQAEVEYREAIAGLERKLGPRDPRLAAALERHAAVLDSLSRAAEAEPVLRRAIDILRETLGPLHPQLGHALQDLSILCNQTGRHEEARVAIEEAIAIWSEPGMNRAFGLRDLASTFMYLNRYAEAKALYEQSIPLFREFGGETSPELWRAVAFLGDARTRMGEVAAAEGDLRLAVAKLEINPGPTSYQIRMPLRLLAENRRRAGNPAEAIEILRRVRALELELFETEEHRDIAVTDRRLGIALIDVGTPEALAEARGRLDNAIALDRKFRPGAPHLAESLAASAMQRLRSGGDPAVARAELVEAVAIFAGRVPAGDPRRVEADATLAKLAGR